MGFDNAKMQFMNMIGSPSKTDADTGKKTAATGLFAESEELADRIEAIDKKIAVSSGEEKSNYEKQKQELIDGFTNKVAGLTQNYMNLFTITGGLEDWQKDKIVSILMLGKSFSSAFSDSYQYADSSEAYLNERALAQQRYLNAGLPGGPSLETLGQNEKEATLTQSSFRQLSISSMASLNRRPKITRTRLNRLASRISATNSTVLSSKFMTQPMRKVRTQTTTSSRKSRPATYKQLTLYLYLSSTNTVSTSLTTMTSLMQSADK